MKRNLFSLGCLVMLLATIFASCKQEVPVSEMVTISYVSEFGNLAKTEKIVEKGYKLKSEDLVALTHVGYNFDKWYINNKEAKPNTVINKDTVLVGKWNKVLDETAPKDVTFYNSIIAENGKAVIKWEIPIDIDKDLKGFELSMEPKSGTLLNPVILSSTVNSFSVDGLENDKKYVFTLKSFDSSMNFSKGVSKTVTPIDKSDRIAPKDITNLNVKNFNGTIKLSWKDPNDEDLFGIEISYKENVKVNTTRTIQPLNNNTIIVAPGTMYAEVPNLTKDKEYTFTLKAMDLSGNKSDGLKENCTPKITEAKPEGSVNSKDNPVRLKIGKEKLMGGYFRTWHDKNGAAGDEEKPVNSMADVPDCVDILCVFHDYTPNNSPFWGKLKDEYVPKLNKQGTQVVRTIGFDFLAGKKTSFSNDVEYMTPLEIAKRILKEYVTDHNLNGLDIDYEYTSYHYLSEIEQNRAWMVFLEIGKLIGPKGADKSKLLIMDLTNATFGNFMLHLKDYIDLFFLQVYAGDDYNISQLINPLKNQYLFENDKMLLGYTFYEEGSNSNASTFKNFMVDTSHKEPLKDMSIENIAKTDAAFMTNYTLKWEKKRFGGVFGYAIDRDGVAFGNNEKFIETKYPWTIALDEMMNKK